MNVQLDILISISRFHFYPIKIWRTTTTVPCFTMPPVHIVYKRYEKISIPHFMGTVKTFLQFLCSLDHNNYGSIHSILTKILFKKLPLYFVYLSLCLLFTTMRMRIVAVCGKITFIFFSVEQVSIIILAFSLSFSILMYRKCPLADWEKSRWTVASCVREPTAKPSYLNLTILSCCFKWVDYYLLMHANIKKL